MGAAKMRSVWFSWLGLTALASLLAVCHPSPKISETPAPLGVLEVQISDHREAIDDFERLDITVTSIGLHLAKAPRAEGWLEFEPDMAVVDLTQVIGDPAVTVLETTVPLGEYDAVRLVVASGEGVLKEGGAATVPGFEEIVRHAFTLWSGDSATLVLDVFLESQHDHPDGGYEMNLLSVITAPS